MSGTFPGRIVLVEGDEVDVDLQIAAEKIRLATPFAEIGLWDRHSIHFQRNPTGGYELSVADDVVTFYPADVEAFAVAVEGLLSGSEDPIEEAPGRPVSLVPDPIEEKLPETGEDLQAAEFASVAEPDVEEDAVSRFGPSSRERLAAAMSGFRRRSDEDDDEPEQPPERTSSEGFVIPGDSGYTYPSDDVVPVDFDEDLEEDTVADQVLKTSRSLRGASSVSVDKARLKRIGIGATIVAVVVAVAFAVPVVVDFFAGSDGEASPATAPQATVPVTASQDTTPATTEATVVESTAVAEPLAFDISINAFVERWNDTAAMVSPNLRFRSSLPAGDFEVGFTPYISMIGSFAGPAVGIDGYTLEIDPTGPSSSDQLGIQALGLAIAVADQSLEPSERAAVLAEMGLNVRDPQLGELNGTTTRNGVAYRLVYDAEAVLLRLEISPPSP